VSSCTVRRLSVNMKNFLLAAFLGVVGVSLVSGDCQHDLDTCKAAFSRGLPNTKTSQTALCNVGNTFVSCLRDIHGCPDSVQTTIDNERRKTEEMLQRNASQCMLCTK